ncbi:hypothetical protein [Sphingomonas sp.]|uniref:hypothetical protein n=1 Tax=Sphingomonas sp. TaxID=28214 RepID=UPI002EDA9D5D
MARSTVVAMTLALGVSQAQAQTIDRIDFGDARAAGEHAVRLSAAQMVPGALGQAAVRLKPRSNGDWRGGNVAFRLKVAPDVPNFLSIRLWGGDVVQGGLTLICGGKQVGDRLLSDYDQLDYGVLAPQFPGAFYRTLRLPDVVTRGRTTRNSVRGGCGPLVQRPARRRGRSRRPPRRRQARSSA